MDMVLKYQEKEVRTVEREDGIWFVLADVCAVLGVENSRDVAKKMPKDELHVDKIYTSEEYSKSELGYSRDMTLINEPGLYRVILRSNKPEAEPFVRWVTHDVLPSIRKTGIYVDPSFSMSSFDIARLSARTHGQTLKMMVDLPCMLILL
jgi:prophage antirepressor-like protein